MILIYYFLLFILGTAVGSFIGVVVDRIASKESIWKGRSHCDHCRHILHPFDLIPVVSFLFLKRKCRYCHKELSWFYPLVELCTGIAYLAVGYALFQQSSVLLTELRYQLLALYYLSMIGALIGIFFTDLRYGIIPFKIVVFALMLTVLWDASLPLLHFTQLEVQLLGLQINALPILISALGAGGFFFFLFAITKGRGMGFGDVVYALLMGLTLGFPRVLLGLYIAFVTGAVVSLLLVVLKKKKLKGGTIPFGPFLVLGTIISLLWGKALIDFFLLHLV